MRNLFRSIPFVLIGMQASAWADTVLSGTEIAVRPDQPITVQTWDRGRIYSGRIARDVRDGDVAIPRGAEAELIVCQTGPNEMVLDLESITVNGQRYAVDSNGPEFQTSGGGLLGNILGAVTNGQVQVETRGSQIQVPADAVIRFELREPLHVVGWNDPAICDRVIIITTRTTGIGK